MKEVIYIIGLAIFIQGCNTLNSNESYSLGSEKKVILNNEGPDDFFYWELMNEDRLWGVELGAVNGLNKYRDTLKLELGNQVYKSAIEKEAAQNVERALIEKEENGDRINAWLVHSGSIGKIRKINYLEGQLLNYQIEKFPMFSRPTEFHAFITKNEKLGKIRVYFGGSDTEWAPRPTVIIKELEKDSNKDWKLIRHLHNHYCEKDKNYVGILAPSLADAQYFKMLKERFNVEKTLITNGFHTVEIESKDFTKFESH